MDPSRKHPRRRDPLSVDTAIDITACLRCGYRGECLSGDKAAKPGSLSVCMRCSAITVLGEDMRLRPLTDAELARVLADGDVLMRLLEMTAALRLTWNDYARRN